ncbi:MAG: hypothetical protein KDB60_05755 [Propionibacteriaceae bacterium]|nr:hypothetical protein [Propionibacteriaceae bacterium]
MTRVRIVATLFALVLLAACAPTPDPAAEGAVAFETRAVPMVGGFCSYFAEDQAGKPCVEGMDLVFAAAPEMRDEGSSDQFYRVVAQVDVSLETRKNTANPPQSSMVTVWTVTEVVSVTPVS